MKTLPGVLLTGVLLIAASVSAWSQKTTRSTGATRASGRDTTASRIYAAPPVTPPAATNVGGELPPAAFPSTGNDGLILPYAGTAPGEADSTTLQVPDKKTGYEPGESRRRFRRENETRTETHQPRAHNSAASSDVLFGLSTNVAADLVTAVNIGAELPMWDRWDLRAEVYSPWWKSNANSFCFQIFHADAGVRYYLRPWERRDDRVLRGWFLSAHAGGGYYDVAPWGDGYQGWEIAAGIGGGYSLAVGRWWRLDAGLAVGPFYTDYITYEDTGNRSTLLQTGEGSKLRFLPTEVRISLTYLFHRKKQ